MTPIMDEETHKNVLIWALATFLSDSLKTNQEDALF